MNRGDIYLADLNPTRGSEQSGIRPVVIVQRNLFARFTNTIVVIPFTTNIRRLKIPCTILIPEGEAGLTQDSIALCHQITVLDQQRLTQKLGTLSIIFLHSLEHASNYTLQLD